MIHLNDYNPYKDGIHDDAIAINKAIKDLKEGDTLVIDDGEYMCSTIFLKSNMSLYLSSNTRIKMVNNIALLYDIHQQRSTSLDVPSYEDCEYNGKPSKYFIYGKGLKNVKIIGYGSIDGNEEIFYGKKSEHFIEGTFYPRVPLVYLEDIKGLCISNIVLQRSAFWTLHMVGCEDVLIDSIKIKNNPIMVNCDGIDPDHCKNVVIKGCEIEAADDCIVLKNTEAFSKYGDTYNIRVSNCILKSTSSAIKIGTETVGNFEDIHFKNIRIYDSNRGISIMNRDGASINNVMFENIDIKCHQVSPVEWWGRDEIIYISNIKRNENSNIGVISNVTYKSINASSENGILIFGDNINNIRIEDLTLKREIKTKWPKKDIDLRPSVYNVIEGEFHDLYSKGSRDIKLINTNLVDVVMEE